MQEAMRGLVEGLVASHEARSMGLASLRRDVSAHRERARGHVQELEETAAKSREESQASLEGLASARGVMARHLKAMGRLERDDLSRGRAQLASAFAERTAEIQTWLGQIASANTSAAQQLRADLAQADARRRSEILTWMGELIGDRLAARRADLQQQVGELRADLRRGWASLSCAEARRKSEVHAWIGQVATERAGARQEWQRLGVTMRGKRNGGTAVTEELTALGNRAFQYLANHPDGTRLTEIEREFGLGRLQAGRLVRRLLDEGKAEKRGLSYFAT